jgi:predicted glycosyltransferase involved in capsule biosynthesis
LNNNYTFTYIIGYRHKLERLNNLKRVLDWLNGFQGVEIILVEQDKSPKLPAYSLKGFKYIFTKSDMPYNRSWAFNVGLKYSTTNIIALGDSDLIMDPQEFINSVKLLEQYECVSPYNTVLDLTQQESNFHLEKLKSINRPGRGQTDNQKINLTGGIVLYRKDSFMKLGGFCEDLIGWGGEDDYQTFKTKMFLTWTEAPNRCYHLYHDKVKPDMIYYQRNLQLLNTLIKMNQQETQRYINNSFSKTGLKNKYADK